MGRQAPGSSGPTRPSQDVLEPFLSNRATRNKIEPEALARLAWEYVIRVHEGDRNPARSLADEFPGSSFKTWANLFSRARAAGFLTKPPRRGVAGGELTEAAWELLALAPQPSPELYAEYLDERDLDDNWFGSRAEEAWRAAQPKRRRISKERQMWRDLGVDRDGGEPRRSKLPEEAYETFDDWFERAAEEEREERLMLDSEPAWVSEALGEPDSEPRH